MQDLLAHRVVQPLILGCMHIFFEMGLLQNQMTLYKRSTKITQFTERNRSHFEMLLYPLWSLLGLLAY